MILQLAADFRSLLEVRVTLEQRGDDYNKDRFQSALGYLTSVEPAAGRNGEKWEVFSRDLNNPGGLFKSGLTTTWRF